MLWCEGYRKAVYAECGPVNCKHGLMREDRVGLSSALPVFRAAIRVYFLPKINRENKFLMSTNPGDVEEVMNSIAPPQYGPKKYNVTIEKTNKHSQITAYFSS